VDVDAVLGGLYELIALQLTEKQRHLLAARPLAHSGVAAARGWHESVGLMRSVSSCACSR